MITKTILLLLTALLSIAGVAQQQPPTHLYANTGYKPLTAQLYVKHTKASLVQAFTRADSTYFYEDDHSIEVIIGPNQQIRTMDRYDNRPKPTAKAEETAAIQRFIDDINKLCNPDPSQAICKTMIDYHGRMVYYQYDGNGRRTAKITLSTTQVAYNFSQVVTIVLYPDPYTTIHTDGTYTTHIYNGSERVVSYHHNDTLPHVNKKPTFNWLKEMIAHQNKDPTHFLSEHPVDTNKLVLADTKVRYDKTITTRYYHYDQMGNITFVTDPLGRVMEHLAYLPYGQLFVYERKKNPRLPYQFGAKERDWETGLDYFEQRYYDSRDGLFISVDPLADLTGSSYGYGNNNPYRFSDPTGMYPVEGGGGGKGSTKENPHELEAVTVYSSPRKYDRAQHSFNQSFNAFNYDASQVQRWSNERYRHKNGERGFDNDANYAREEQANEEWRSANYLLLDIATSFLPLPKLSVVSKLSKSASSTFRFGKSTSIILKNPLILSRYYDNVNAFAKGHYMTDATSSSKFLDRIGLALRPSWNKMTHIAHWEIPAGSTIYKGKAAMQFPWLGGKNQYIIPNLNNLKRVKQ